mmetsp:Transcript_19089/g.28871  ORF Transcript_19089/g.28871 Transcript_19089/m.28871 type:complete len:314 (-) Transcript_19089:195-1136(-)|eukprot:CAMPEP_0197309516 /NCGR_PEP_ID=MMETSP0891-20130614/8096_1 /TAXON_ID=44058 ORGANISM="Aureoumbra lagunensis, Strain CCMP1510" /NCGR_SAMPLE_ID=MMETSP0891 /ASSEMBLY_ACC=CAM_ASM_000534 /LENGTH=313 /DNA_ID=CAMNT_0042794619 /DNA_START=773 /DNA_END=1714 /DNA_ORIENTATION=+
MMPFRRAASICALGLTFLAAFGYACVVALIRLEYDDTSNGIAGGVACPELDASLVWRALLAQALAILIARHLVDTIGRRPTIAALCAVAAAGVLCVAGPSYFPNFIQINDARQLLFAVLISRGALSAALSVIALLLIETHAAPARAPAGAAFAIISTFASLLAQQWVIIPNPVATVALLLTLVDISAAWAALALPIESAGHSIDTLIALNPLHAAVALKHADQPATLLGIADIFELDFSTSAVCGTSNHEDSIAREQQPSDESDSGHQDSKHAAEDTPLLSHVYSSSSPSGGGGGFSVPGGKNCDVIDHTSPR